VGLFPVLDQGRNYTPDYNEAEIMSHQEIEIG
jgi:hypothetical protein